MKEAWTRVRFNLLGDCRKPALYVIFITLSCSKQRMAGCYNIHPASYMFSMLQKLIYFEIWRGIELQSFIHGRLLRCFAYSVKWAGFLRMIHGIWLTPITIIKCPSSLEHLKYQTLHLSCALPWNSTTSNRHTHPLLTCVRIDNRNNIKVIRPVPPSPGGL